MKCAAVDCPAWSCSAVIKAGKHPWGLPAFFDFWEGLVVELRPTVGFIFHLGAFTLPGDRKVASN